MDEIKSAVEDGKDGNVNESGGENIITLKVLTVLV